MQKSLNDPVAENFYSEVLKVLNLSRIPYMVGGTYALGEHANIFRKTKDLDLFCKRSDFPKINQTLQKQGFKTELTDDRWLGKAVKDKYLIDFIFNSSAGLCPVDDSWFEHAPTVKLFGHNTKLVPVEEMIWSKVYFQEKDHYDGADVNHMILKKGKSMDWKRLLLRMEVHWEVLLAQLISFRFIYPSEKECVPKWVMKELVARLNRQLSLPFSQDKVCRGPLLARIQYTIDIEQWGYHLIT